MKEKRENKKILIYLTGRADSPFFYNEIESLVQTFDKVYVITYYDKTDTAKCIEHKYNITITVIKMGLRLLIYSPYIIRLLFRKNIREEFRYISTKYHGRSKIFCIAYALYYMLFSIGVTQRVKRILKDNAGCDTYLYSFWMSRTAFALAMMEREGCSNIRIKVSRAHGYDLYEERNKINYLPFKKLIAQRVDKILFISDNGKKYFQQYLDNRNIQANKLEVIHMGVDNSKYIKKYRLKDTIVIASCSSVIKIKRLDMIIFFLQIIRLKAKIRWLHIGDGSQMKEIQAMAARELTDVQFQFLGNVDNKKIADIYRKEDVDFFINMSDSEGIPVSIMEAFSSGIPAIARNVGGISEIVNNTNGFLLESLDTKYLEDTAEKIVKSFQEKERYALLSKNALTMQRQNFERETNNLKLIKAIKGES